MTTPKRLFEAVPAMAFAASNEDWQDGPRVPLQADPTGPYGIAVARLTSGAGFTVTGTTADHMLGFIHSRPVPVSTWFCGRRFDPVLGPRSLAISPAGVDCVCEIGGPADFSLVRVSTECLSLAKAQLAPPGSTLVERTEGRDAELSKIGLALEAEATAGYPNGVLFWSSAADAFIRHTVEHHLSEKAAPAQSSLGEHDIRRLDDYIRANVAGTLDLDSLAAVVGCDRFHFVRRFRAAVGVTPHRYVVRRRLDHARVLMRARAGSMAEIASTAGFYDQSHLTRWVRRVYGATPRQLMQG